MEDLRISPSVWLGVHSSGLEPKANTDASKTIIKDKQHVPRGGKEGLYMPADRLLAGLVC